MTNEMKPQMKVNKARGEVLFQAGGNDFVLVADLGRIAAWTSEVGVTSLEALNELLRGANPQVVLAGLRHFCKSDNADDIGSSIIGMNGLTQGMEALAEALNYGAEEGDDAPLSKEAPLISPGPNGNELPTES